MILDHFTPQEILSAIPWGMAGLLGLFVFVNARRIFRGY